MDVGQVRVQAVVFHSVAGEYAVRSAENRQKSTDTLALRSRGLSTIAARCRAIARPRPELIHQVGLDDARVHDVLQSRTCLSRTVKPVVKSI